MSFSNLSSFLSFIEKRGDLHRIKAEVDPILEITEIATRVVKNDGPAILFENVKGSTYPAVINLLGAKRRVEWALGRPSQEVGEELAHFSEVLMHPSLSKFWQARRSVSRLLSLKPKKVSRAPFTAHEIHPVGLGKLPIAKSWPKDAGRFITFPLVITKSPASGRYNMGVYRLQVFGEDQTGMHWQIGKGGGYHYFEAEKKGENLEVSVAVGADPILMLCGVLPLPEGVEETAVAGFLRGEATRLAQVGKGGLLVPAEAEFVLQGVVPPLERRSEGPYGDHFGHYSHQADFPVFHVKKIYHRSRPVFPLAVVGKPPQEDNFIGEAATEILLPLLKLMHPEIADLWAYPAAGFHNLVVASVRQRFRKEGIKTALWILGEGQLALSKCVILVDEFVNPRNFSDVLKAVRMNFKPEDDFTLLPGTSQDTLDFTSFKMNLGSKMILDATSIGEKNSRSAGGRFDPEALQKLDSRIREVNLWSESMAVLRVDGPGRNVLEKVVKSGVFSGIPLAAAVSADVPLNNESLMLWGIFTRFDCRRDTLFTEVSWHGDHPKYSGTMGIDATWKPGYPEPLEMTKEIVAKVDRRWKEYGFAS